MTKMGVSIFIGILFLFPFLSVMSLTDQTKEIWEDQGLEWYYDNLTTEDRQKIRQAMDYAIPREQICLGLYYGYAFPIATEIAPNIVGHDPSIQAREYNITKSKELLAEVFGKWYEDPADAESSETITNTPYFNITLIAPYSNTRSHYESMVSYAFNKIGINTKLKWWIPSAIHSNIIHEPSEIGYNYAHDGFDGVFLEVGLNSDPDLGKRYYSTNFVPIGENYQWIENGELTKIINRSITEPEYKNRLFALEEFQVWFHEWVPSSLIHQRLNRFPQRPDLLGLDPYNYAREPWVHNLSLGESEKPFNFTTCVTGDLSDFNPVLSTNWNDSVISSNLHLSLAGRRGAYNLTHLIGQVAKSWYYTPDGREWTVSLRQGLKFHDGSEVTADDVVFSYKAAMECPDSQWIEKMISWFMSSNDISKVDTYTVKFHLKQFFPYVTSQIFSIPILSKKQMETIPFADWKTHGTNTGEKVLLGCGPYQFIEYDGTKEVISQKASSWNFTLMGHDPTAIGGGIWWNNTRGPEIFYTVIYKEKLSSDLETPFNGLEKGIYDLIDPNYADIIYIDNYEEYDWIKIRSYPQYRFIELGFNHYDPRWGLNPHDPREMYTLDYSINSFGGIDFMPRLLLGGFVIISIILLVVLLNRKIISE